MPLATLPIGSSSTSPAPTKSSFLSAFKKNKSAGTFQISYTIATPRSANAKVLERGLPTVIFLHAVYLSQAMFHGQSQRLGKAAEAELSDPSSFYLSQPSSRTPASGASTSSASTSAAMGTLSRHWLRSPRTTRSRRPQTTFFTSWSVSFLEAHAPNRPLTRPLVASCCRTRLASSRRTSWDPRWGRLSVSPWQRSHLSASSASLRCRPCSRSRCAAAPFPHLSLSPDPLLLLSHRSAQPVEVLEGREEIGVYWREGVSNNDTQALLDAARGAIELLFGERPSNDVARIIGVALPLAIRNWAETGQQGVSRVAPSFSKRVPLLTLLVARVQSEIHRRVTIHPFTRRKPLTKAELARIRAPVVVIHSGEDAVTPLEGSEGLVREMREAGVGGARGVQLKIIPRAAHVRPSVSLAAVPTFARR